MKVLQINCVYRKGSTGKIVYDIHTELQHQSIESVVCYGRGQVIEEPHVYKFCKEVEANIHTLVIRTGIVLNYGGNYFSTNRLINIIRQERPDIVHVHCINGSCVNIYRFFRFLAVNNIKTIITHHAEFYYTGSCEHAYDCRQFMSEKGCQHCARPFRTTRSKTWDNSSRAWRSMKKAIRLFAYENLMFTAVSPWVKERSGLSPIVNQYRCKVVMNGVNTDVFNDNGFKNLIDGRIKESYKLKALFVGAYFNPQIMEDNKGGWYIVEMAKRMPDVLFVIVALRMISCEGLPKNVFVWGATKNQEELASLYRSADVTVITSKRETFSMVCAESLCCGTPVVGFKAGGPESIAIPEYGEFVDYGKLDGLMDKVQAMAQRSLNHIEIADKAKTIYSRKTMVSNYLSLYKELM